MPGDWVFIQELAFDIGLQDFDWGGKGSKSLTWWDLEEMRIQQKKEFQKEAAKKKAHFKKFQKKAAAKQKAAAKKKVP